MDNFEIIQRKIEATKMRFLRNIEGKNMIDKIRNSTFTRILNTKPIEDSIEEIQPMWLGYIKRMKEKQLENI